MINAAIVTFVGYLSHESQRIFAILEDEVEIDTGEIFCHMWMGRVAAAFCKNELDVSEIDKLLQEAERQIQHGDENLQNLIAVSFVENLPPPLENGFELISQYPSLLAQYKKVFGEY